MSCKKTLEVFGNSKIPPWVKHCGIVAIYYHLSKLSVGQDPRCVDSIGKLLIFFLFVELVVEKEDFINKFGRDSITHTFEKFRWF